MPEQSIINKMRMDGCHPALVSEFKGEEITIDSLKTKKTNNEEKEEEFIPQIDLKDPKFAKYLKMKKIGMPLASILNKMRLDGFSKDEIDGQISQTNFLILR